jgi:hypothetical protein
MSSERNSTAIGFLSVVRHEPHGLFGGYLLLNRNGRPLEFHCTAPLKPNRAQEILYGATLESYLYGEAIGATLTAKSSAPIDFLCVDVEAALAVRDFVDAPVAFVTTESEPIADDQPLFRVDGPHAGGLTRFKLGRYAGAVSKAPRRRRSPVSRANPKPGRPFRSGGTVRPHPRRDRRSPPRRQGVALRPLPAHRLTTSQMIDPGEGATAAAER